jgi:DNA-binding SARP family transcriptional activator
MTSGHVISRRFAANRVISSSADHHQEELGVEFRILGPLEVVGADGPLDVRGAKRRGLIAFLLIHAGEWLSTDRIVEELWEADASTGATRTVQTYVSQLRRALDHTSARLTSRDGGYSLELEPDVLDAARFEQQVRRVDDIEDPLPRLQSLEAVLALWRGTPLDEFDHPWADRERARLTLLHLQARDARIDARLALGVDTALIAELEQLVEEQPLDERFWAKLLVAYYRAGRQADALRAFQRVRSTLAGELGIDPGPELVQLEQQILTHDATLLTPTEREAAILPPPTMPTGTVTFLFTDIVDSTQLWEEQPDAMRRVVADHQQLLREAVEGHHGHVVKSIGDGMMAVFADAPSAVDAAIDAQLAISHAAWTVPIGVRVGVHTGVAHLIDGDYHAPTVNRAARVAATAHPGRFSSRPRPRR